MSLPRRTLVALLPVATALAAGLVGCGDAKPAPEAEATASRLGTALAEIDGVTSSEARVHIPRRSPRARIVGNVTVRPDLDLAELTRVARAFRAALEAHQFPPYLTEGRLTTSLDGHEFSWEMDLAAPGELVGPTVETAYEELDRGASSVQLDRYGVRSSWERMDDRALLAPVGRVRVGRGLTASDSAGTFTWVDVVVFPDQRIYPIPFTSLATPMIGIMRSIRLGFLDNRVSWQLSPRSERIGGADDPLLRSTAARFLRDLLARPVAPEQDVEFMPPWGVKLRVADTVTITEWNNDATRAQSEAVVIGLLEELNR